MQDRQAMESASTQTNSLRTRSIASATISTDSRSTDSDSEARTRIARLKYLVCILLIAVVMLLGTNALFCVQRSALKVRVRIMPSVLGKGVFALRLCFIVNR